MYSVDQVYENQKQRIAELEAKVERLEGFVSLCKSLTGSLWPQNETTELLAEQLAALENKQDG